MLRYYWKFPGLVGFGDVGDTGENAGAERTPQSRDQATAHAGLARPNSRCSGDAKLGLVRRLFGKKRYRTLFKA